MAKSWLAVLNKGDRNVILTLGNESADLDSLVSSILYSFLKTASAQPGIESPLYVPLLNLPENKIRLRPEFLHACQQIHVNASSSLTLDSLTSTLEKSAKTHWFLVDHNRPTGQFAHVPAEKLVGVIDHHEDENFVPRGHEAHVIEKAGSCTSLVVRECKALWDAMSSTNVSDRAHDGVASVIEDGKWSIELFGAPMAKFALAPILIDTSNLTSSGKVEAADRDAVEFLERKILSSPQEAKSWDREAFYQHLRALKTDLTQFNLEEILEKDYKQWNENGMNLGMSTVVKDFAFLINKAGEGHLNEQLKDFAKQRDLAIYAIMMTFTSEKGKHERQLYLRAEAQAHKVMERFLQVAQGDLQLEQLAWEWASTEEAPPGHGIWIRVWKQGDKKKSRKQVAPMLRSAMQT